MEVDMIPILKSLGAGAAGLATGALLSVGADFLLESLGVLPRGNLRVSWWLIAAVILYRTAFNALGCFLAAFLAPSHPMRHALALGALGAILSVLGALTTANRNLGPAWYAWTLAVLVLPGAWLGGRVDERRREAKAKPAG
jgi:hypothetical protein